MKRRQLLTGLPALALSAGALVSGGAQAIGPRSEVSIGRLKHGGTWDTRPEALRRMLWEAGKRTSIQVARDAVLVSLDGGAVAVANAVGNAAGNAGGASRAPEGDELFWQPLLVLTGEGALPPFDARARARLERHLRFGGTLIVDAPSPSDAFWDSAKKEIGTVMGGAVPRALEADHVIFKSFYLLDGAIGRVAQDKNLYSIDLGGRAAVIFSSNDLLGALERDRFGTWRFDCEPDAESQREMSFRLATNLLMYATCIDYKADQVHIPFIMKKKRR